MKKFAILLFLVASVGCATARKPTSPELSDNEKLYQVVQLCDILSRQHSQDKRYTDCKLSNNRIHFVFADAPTAQGERVPVASMVQAFCFASQGRAQKTLNLRYSWRYAKEGVEISKACPKVSFVTSPEPFGTEGK